MSEPAMRSGQVSGLDFSVTMSSADAEQSSEHSLVIAQKLQLSNDNQLPTEEESRCDLSGIEPNGAGLGVKTSVDRYMSPIGRRGASVGGPHAYGSPSAGVRTTEVRRRSSSALGFNTGKSLGFASSDADNVTTANESR